MTQYEMAEKLSEKCNVTLEEAETALQMSCWNTLTATHLLEKEQFRRMQALNEVAADCEAMAEEAAAEESAAEATVEQASTEEQPETTEVKAHRRHRGRRKLGTFIRRVVALGNRNRFEVRKDGQSVLDMPVTAMVLLLLFAFWVCVPLLVIGAFAGYRYSFGGKELGRDAINNALAKAADAADRMKERAVKA